MVCLSFWLTSDFTLTFFHSLNCFTQNLIVILSVNTCERFAKVSNLCATRENNISVKFIHWEVSIKQNCFPSIKLYFGRNVNRVVLGWALLLVRYYITYGEIKSTAFLHHCLVSDGAMGQLVCNPSQLSAWIFWWCFVVTFLVLICCAHPSSGNSPCQVFQSLISQVTKGHLPEVNNRARQSYVFIHKPWDDWKCFIQ